MIFLSTDYADYADIFKLERFVDVVCETLTAKK